MYILFEAQQLSSADGKGQLVQFQVDVNAISIITLLKFSFLCARITGFNNTAILLLYNEITLVPIHRIRDTLLVDNVKLCLDGTESVSWPPEA